MLSVSLVVGPVRKTSRNLPICTSSPFRQRRPVHGFTVDVRAVEAADVDNLEFAAYAPELGVPAADGDVIEEDLAIRVTTGRRGGLVEQEPRPGVRAALHHQQRRALRQRLRTQKPALGGGGGRRVLLVGEVGTKREVLSPVTSPGPWSLSLSVIGCSLPGCAGGGTLGQCVCSIGARG
jgi:hypothetical protein